MRAHNASFPINMPSKAPQSASYYPVSRIAGSPPEVSDVSTTTGSASGEYDSSAGYSGVDVIDTLNDRMGSVFDPSRLDQGIAKQTQLYVSSLPPFSTSSVLFLFFSFLSFLSWHSY